MPTEVPIAERIERQLCRTLGTMTGVPTVGSNPAVFRMDIDGVLRTVQGDTLTDRLTAGMVLVKQEGDTYEYDEGPVNVQEHVIRFVIGVVLVPSESATTSLASSHNLWLSRVRRILRADIYLTETASPTERLAHNVVARENVEMEDDNGTAFAAMRVDVIYRCNTTDDTQLTGLITQLTE